jgi:hypothetical protein
MKRAIKASCSRSSQSEQRMPARHSGSHNSDIAILAPLCEDMPPAIGLEPPILQSLRGASSGVASGGGTLTRLPFTHSLWLNHGVPRPCQPLTWFSAGRNSEVFCRPNLCLPRASGALVKGDRRHDGVLEPIFSARILRLFRQMARQKAPTTSVAATFYGGLKIRRRQRCGGSSPPAPITSNPLQELSSGLVSCH